VAIRGWLLQLSYRLSRHYVGLLSIGVWIVALGLIVVLIGLLPKVWLSPAVMSSAGVIALLTLALLIWGRLSQYHHFRVQDEFLTPATESRPMRGLEQVCARATGKFSVEGKERFFVDLEAIYHSFDTREHVIMAHVPPSRFLLLAKSRKELLGMWYAFLRPEQIEIVEAGVLAFGRGRKPALRITYRGEKRSEKICLAFETDGDKNKVAADLRHDLQS